MHLQIVQNKAALFASVVLLMIVSGLLLIGPRVPYSQQKSQCVVDLHIVGPLGLSLNCDSPEFMKDAVHPGNLLKKNSVRQSRPGMVLAAYLLSKPLFFLNKIADWYHPHVTRKDIAKGRINALWQAGFSVFAAYAMLNIVILMFACFFYFSLVKVSEGITLASLSLVVLFFVNSITETYFWSPHTQMFNIMGPLFLAWVFYRGLQNSILNKSWYLISLAMGLLVTAYGTFILYAPCLFLLFVYQFFTKKEVLFFNYFKRLLMHAVIFSLPTIAWYLLVKHVAGSYYVHEAVVYRQFTWMRDAFHQGVGPLLYQLFANTTKTLHLVIMQNYYYFIALAAIIFAASRYGFNTWDRKRFYAFAILALICTLFVIFNGFIIPRMTSTVIPISIAACGYGLECLSTRVSGSTQRYINILLVAIVVAYSANSLWY
jgi:hypothetical protein